LTLKHYQLAFQGGIVMTSSCLPAELMFQQYLFGNEWSKIIDFIIKKRAFIVESLREAEVGLRAGEYGFEFTILFGQCCHQASKVILDPECGCNTETIIKQIKENPAFNGVDPTVIIMGAILYYLLCSDILGLASIQLSRIRSRFADMNWLTAPRIMCTLQME
jgi:hypothetical protein